MFVEDWSVDRDRSTEQANYWEITQLPQLDDCEDLSDRGPHLWMVAPGGILPSPYGAPLSTLSQQQLKEYSDADPHTYPTVTTVGPGPMGPNPEGK